MVEQPTSPPAEVAATMNPPNVVESVKSNEALVVSNSMGGMESTCNSIHQLNNGEGTSAAASEASSLEFSDRLTAQGTEAMKDNDFSEASDCFSRALEIRVGHYGELAPECVKLYYKYGCALLYKAQEEADPLGNVPKNDSKFPLPSDQDSSVKNAVNGETSSASASSLTSITNEENSLAISLKNNLKADAQDEETEEGDVEESDTDTEDLVDAVEDETDLDLAWKMLDVARAIVEKHNDDTIEKVDILSALAEVALEREDIEASCSDYHKALSILERIAEPDSRQIAELNFRICLCLELGSKPQEAVPLCQKAISICKSRVLRLMEEVKCDSAQVISVSDGSRIDNSAAQKEDEIAIMNDLLGELEKKLEDLQQLALNPKPILSELLGMASSKAKSGGTNGPQNVINSSQIVTSTINNGCFDSPTVSTVHSDDKSAVTHLGVVGRGVKRVLMNAEPTEPDTKRKTASDRSQDKDQYQDKSGNSSTS